MLALAAEPDGEGKNPFRILVLLPCARLLQNILRRALCFDCQ
jgi:hypothetical protein